MAKRGKRAPGPERSRAIERAAVPRSRRTGGAPLIAVLLLIVVGSWAYSTSFAGVFVLDDIEGLVTNAHIRTLWPPSTVLTAPPDTGLGGRPFASLTFAINHALAPEDARDVMRPAGPGPADAGNDAFHRNVWGYHAVNLAIHLMAALALFGVVRRSLLTPPLKDTFADAALPLALSVSALWLVHPLQTESVTYIIQRIESLSGMFLLVTLYAGIRATEQGRRRWWWVAGAILACTLGMGTKEVTAAAPILVALWIWIFHREAVVADARLLRVLLIGLAATWVPLGLSLASGARAASVGVGLGGWTWWLYLETQAGVIAHYLRLACVPTPLVFIYDWMPATSLGSVAPQALLLVSLFVFSAVQVIRRRPSGFLGVWFFVILAPTSSVIPIATEVASEHRMYLPLAAVIAAIVLGFYALGRRFSGRTRAARPVVVGGWLIVALAVAALATLTRERNRDYWSDEALMRDTVANRPQSLNARLRYGADLYAMNRYAEAQQQLEAALAAPRMPGSETKRLALVHMYLGGALGAQGKAEESIPHLQQAVELDSGLGEAYGFLAEAYLSRGEGAKAVGYLDQAIAHLPGLPPLLNREAWLLATLPDDAVRNGAKAITLAEQCVQLSGGRDAGFLETLAAAYAEAGRFRDAQTTAERALALARSEGDAQLASELQSDLLLYQSDRKLRKAIR